MICDAEKLQQEFLDNQARGKSLGERLEDQVLARVRRNIVSVEDVNMISRGLEMFRKEATDRKIAAAREFGRGSEPAIQWHLTEAKASRALNRLLDIDVRGYQSTIDSLEARLAKFHGPEDEREGLKQ